LAAVALATATALGACQASAPQPPQLVRSVDNDPLHRRSSAIVLANGQRFQTTLFDVTVLTELRTERKAPYVVMAGLGCVDCDARTAIYIHSPSDGPMQDEGHQPRYPYPGRIISHLDLKTLVSEIRFFMGACVAASDDALVWFVRDRNDKGAWQSSVRVVRVEADNLRETLLQTNLPPLESTLDRVRQGSCRELPGSGRPSEP
jgi:hypothetical protein